jgi:hypothetical protein
MTNSSSAGQNKPIRTIIQIGEEQLRKTQGIPRIVHAWGAGITSPAESQS